VREIIDETLGAPERPLAPAQSFDRSREGSRLTPFEMASVLVASV